MSKSSLVLVTLGLFVFLAGLAWDAAIHASGNHDASNEALFSVANPSHALLGVGLALIVVGAFLGLVRQQGQGPGRTKSSIAGAVLIVFAGAVLAFGVSVDTGGHEHGQHVTDGSADDDAEALLGELRRAGLSEQDIALIHTSRHDHGNEVALSLGDLEALTGEVAKATHAAAKYESISVALDEGYVQITQDLPRIGAHFINLDLSEDGEFDVEKPEMLIYHYKEGRWQLFGLSYLGGLVGDVGDLPPDGFTGSFDTWHWHSNWCFTLKGARVSDGSDCKLPFEFFAPRTGYMVHLWMVDNPDGMFSHAHPGLRGSSEYIVPGSLPLASQAR